MSFLMNGKNNIETKTLKSQSPLPLRDMWHKVKKLIPIIFFSRETWYNF